MFEWIKLLFRKPPKIPLCPCCGDEPELVWDHYWESDGKYRCVICLINSCVVLKGYSPGYFDVEGDQVKVICPHCKNGRCESYKDFEKETIYTHWCNQCNTKHNKRGEDNRHKYSFIVDWDEKAAKLIKSLK